MLIPHSETEAAGIIRDAAEKCLTLEIAGNGTRGGVGNLISAAEKLSSSALSGIVSYAPAEMVMTAQAGTPMSVIEAALAEGGQMLAFEPMDHRGIMGTAGEPTIGGAFAVNASGPRRFTAGAARDHLLGVRFVNGTGEVVKAGGRVMKNVTGLDLVKLLAGSHGTLGFLTEVTFKVLPKPPAETTIVVGVVDDQVAALVMAAAMALSVEVTGAAHLPETVRGRFEGAALPEGGATVLRLEGLAKSVEARVAKLEAAIAAAGPITRIEGEASVGLWRQIRDVRPYADGSERPLWRVSMAPTEGQKLVAALRLEVGIDAFYDWQGGLVWMRVESELPPEMLRGAVKHFGGGHATLLRAPQAIRAVTEAFEPQAPAVAALSRRVKQKFDPNNILNPGRMAKGDAA